MYKVKSTSSNPITQAIIDRWRAEDKSESDYEASRVASCKLKELTDEQLASLQSAINRSEVSTTPASFDMMLARYNVAKKVANENTKRRTKYTDKEILGACRVCNEIDKLMRAHFCYDVHSRHFMLHSN